MKRVPLLVFVAAVASAFCLPRSASTSVGPDVARPAAVSAASGRHPAEGQAARAGKERPVPFKVGETLSYDISWSNYLTAGTATMTVAQKKASYGSVAYYVVVEGRPTALLSALYPVYYKVDALIDAYTLLSQRGSLYSEEGKRRELKTTLFDQAAHKAHYEQRDMPGGRVSASDISIPPFTQDMLTAVYVIRTLPFRTGARMTIPICDEGSTFRVQVTVGGVEKMQTGIGGVRAWHLTPVIQDPHGRPAARTLTLWISDDARRLPVRMEADVPVGSFVILLREAR